MFQLDVMIIEQNNNTRLLPKKCIKKDVQARLETHPTQATSDL